jgi:hypothetical protein
VEVISEDSATITPPSLNQVKSKHHHKKNKKHAQEEEDEFTKHEESAGTLTTSESMEP